MFISYPPRTIKINIDSPEGIASLTVAFIALAVISIVLIVVFCVCRKRRSKKNVS